MTNEQVFDMLLHRPLPNGGWLDFFIRNAESIGKFIQENKLTPIPQTQMPAFAGERPVESAQVARIAFPLIKVPDSDIRGGIRVAHLHFEGKVYILKDEQWAKFSTKIISDCKAKLANVHAVSFDQGMELAEAVQSLP